MKYTSKIYLAGAMALALASCSDGFNTNEAAGEGRVILRPTVSSDFKAPSRAVADDEAQQLADNCLIWISSSKGLVRQYEGISQVPAQGIWLVNGTYTAEAWAGDSVPASWDQRYFKGVEKFTITSGGTTQVNLECTIANVALTVDYDESVDAVLSDYTFTAGHLCGSLTWEGRDERRGYFMMNSRATALDYTLTGKRQDGTVYTLEGSIPDVKAGTHYNLKVKYEATEVEIGGALFTIEIDESTIDVVENIVIVSAPKVTGVYQPLDNVIYGEMGNMERQSVYVAGSTQLRSVTVDLPAVLQGYLGTSGTDFDLVNMDAALVTTLHDKGLTFSRATDEESDTDNFKINFETELLNQLPDGEYAINITATDNNSKTGRGTLNVIISDAPVAVNAISSPSVVWARQATVTCTVMKEGVEDLALQYRAAGTGEWSEQALEGAAFEKAATYSTVLTGLTPGTVYEYRAKSGSFTTGTQRFTTEEARQLPNAGFEDWSTAGDKAIVPMAAGTSFWDTGNHGSIAMSKNITTADETLVHSGSKSIKMESQFVGMGVIGAFAAGNLFTGDFIGVENTTKGILGWGRQWTSRPAALKGYVKYTPQAVTHTSVSNVAKGDMDNGIIYIALVDETTMSYTFKGTTYSYPQIVRTADINNYGFKSTADNIIAYGELVFTEATAGDGLIPFEIKLDYRRTDIKPSNIIITASASLYGDYYTGGPSVMYLDDLELVY